MNTDDTMLLGWAGAELRVPESWEPAVLQPSYLLISDGEGPVLDMKSSHTGKTPSAKALDRALKRMGKRLRVARLAEEDVPKPIAEGLAPLTERGLEYRLFSWDATAVSALGRLIGRGGAAAGAGTASGLGVAVHCAGCRRLLVLRFLRDAPESCGPVLASLLDHHPPGPDGRIRAARIAVFDIRFRPLHGLTLQVARFQPGSFQVELGDKKRALIVDRLSPANVLLQDKTLQDFAAKVLPDAVPPGVSVATDEERLGEMLEWDCDLAKGVLRRVAALLPGTATRRRRWLRMRLWTLPEANRIMALQVKSRKRLDAETFHALCEECDIVQKA